MADDIPAEEKALRASSLMEVQEEISIRKNEAKIGGIYKTIFDRKEGKYFIGRTEADSPEVDNEVLVPAKNSYVRLGDFASVRITGAEAFDLYGEVVV
jgi:ribosomal protein S12 methylthiotransferase